MHFRQAEEGAVPQRPDFVRSVEEFPGPVAIACTPPAGAIALCGGEESDGHPWALQVTYAATGRDLLRVRTVRGALDWTPVIRTIEDLATSMGVFGRSGEPAWPPSSAYCSQKSLSMSSAHVRNRRIATSPSVGALLALRALRTLALAPDAAAAVAGTATALARPACRKNERRPTTRFQTF